MKKIYFPFDESFISVLKNVVKKEAIEDIELIVPRDGDGRKCSKY